MITLLVVLGLIVAGCTAVTGTWFAHDVRRAGGLRALHAELLGIVFVPARREPEIPGQRGWTRDQWADPAWGVDPVTGGPRYDRRTP